MFLETASALRKNVTAHPRVASALAGIFGLAAIVSAPSVYYGLDAQGPEKNFKADAVIVFAGGSGRIARGIEIGRQDGEKKLKVFISGAKEGQNLATVLSMTYPRIVPHPDIGEIELGDRALNTVGNALEAEKWLEQNPALKNVIFVTSNYHQARANLELQRTLQEDIEERFESVNNGFNFVARGTEILKTFASFLGYHGDGPHLREPN